MIFEVWLASDSTRCPSVDGGPNFGRKVLGKLEIQTRFLCHFFAKFHVGFDLVVEVGHALSGMTHPELQKSRRGRREEQLQKCVLEAVENFTRGAR